MRLLSLIATGLAVAACNTSGHPALTTFTDSASYAAGLRMAASIEEQAVDIDVSLVVRGILDGWDSDTSALSQQAIDDLMMRLATEGRQNREVHMMAEADKNIAAGDAFRAKFAAQAGVQQTDSGVLYEVLREGDGPKPGPTDRVEVHYVGTLIDGTVFDSSRERDESITFGLDQVIPGWTQALQLMSVGSTYRIVIPPRWAYGSQGAPPTIGPESTLVFEVELIGIE